MAKQAFVYILASKRNGTLYVGVTSDLANRVWSHKQGILDGFTKRHSVTILVHAEPHETMYAAIVREKQLKKWRRSWKLALIGRTNPAWQDLSADL